MIRLDMVARAYHKVYVDTNVLHLKHTTRRSSSDTRNLSEYTRRTGIDPEWLSTHLRFSERLLEVTEQEENIGTTSDILGEMDWTYKRLASRFRRLQHNRETCDILHNYDTLLDLFESRLEDEQPELSRMICQRKMHVPKLWLFKKGFPKEETDYPDATLVAQAIVAANTDYANAAIISDDRDLANIIWNWGEAYRQAIVAPSVERAFPKQGRVALYAPIRNSWSDELGLKFMCDTEGRLKSCPEVGRVA